MHVLYTVLREMIKFYHELLQRNWIKLVLLEPIAS